MEDHHSLESACGHSEHSHSEEEEKDGCQCGGVCGRRNLLGQVKSPTQDNPDVAAPDLDVAVEPA